jgi:hypothetical protein
MIQMMTAYTEEVDEVEDALNDILGQIDLGALKKNSVGLITCHFDFLDIGFLDALCQKLPFDIVGMTTLASANPHGSNMFSLSLTVLTSDDVSFETAMIGGLNPDNYQKNMKTTYQDAAKKHPDSPALIITFFPFFKEVSGAVMHRAFDEICGGVPFWGSLAADPDISYLHSKVFRNGDVSKDGMVMVLVYGHVDPEFIIVSISEYNIRQDRGQITDSDGCILKEINGVPVVKYLENMGIYLMKDATITTPLMVYYDGSPEPVALGIYNLNDDGSLLCGGEMPKGASITVGQITNEGILSTAEENLNRVLKCGKRNGALFLPCITRHVMLAPNHNAELELIAEKMENGRVMPYMAGYSGGEVCPVRDESGVLRNRFHQYTFSSCIL